MREEYGETKSMHVKGQRVGGNVVMYSCDACGFLHPFNNEKRKKFEREGLKRSRNIRWNIR
jgi:RNase P subunit RPR2